MADSSLKYDCETKSKAYAKSGITDYWVLDVIKRQLHIFRETTQQGYQSEIILEEDGIIAPLYFPQKAIALAQMLPPAIA